MATDTPRKDGLRTEWIAEHDKYYGIAPASDVPEPLSDDDRMNLRKVDDAIHDRLGIPRAEVAAGPRDERIVFPDPEPGDFVEGDDGAMFVVKAAAGPREEPCCSEENPHRAIPTITDRTRIARHWFDEAATFPATKMYAATDIDTETPDDRWVREGRVMPAVGDSPTGVAAAGPKPASSTTPQARDEGLREDLLLQAVDAHMADFHEQPESFDSLAAVSANIARHYRAALADTGADDHPK